MVIKCFSATLIIIATASTAPADIWSHDDTYGSAQCDSFDPPAVDFDDDHVGLNVPFEGFAAIDGASACYRGDCSIFYVSAEIEGIYGDAYSYVDSYAVRFAIDTTITWVYSALDDNQYGYSHSSMYIFDFDTGGYIMQHRRTDSSGTMDFSLSPNQNGYNVYIEVYTSTDSESGYAAATSFIVPAPGAATALALAGFGLAHRRRN